jgi:glycosyltransferase involved in cell wall biosynthesis
VQSEFLIFPSLAESFGLPLLEAANAGCKILAADLAYVYDIIVPTDVFNPLEVESILLAVVNGVNHSSSEIAAIKIKDQINELIYLVAEIE